MDRQGGILFRNTDATQGPQGDVPSRVFGSMTNCEMVGRSAESF